MAVGGKDAPGTATDGRDGGAGPMGPPQGCRVGELSLQRAHRLSPSYSHLAPLQPDYPDIYKNITSVEHRALS